MKNFIIYFCIYLIIPNFVYGYDFKNLPSLKNLIYGNELMDIACYDDDGTLKSKISIDLKKKFVSGGNKKYNFDTSSNEKKINFFTELNNAFHTINLDSFIYTSSLSDINFKNSKILKLIEKNEVFSLLDTNEKIVVVTLNCFNYWGKILNEKKEEIYTTILNEASHLSNKKICKGKAKLGPDDPSVHWNKCLGFVKSGDGTETFIGNFVDGVYSGKGISIYDLYPFTESQIIVGNYSDFELNGTATVYSEAVHTKDKVTKKETVAYEIEVEFEMGEVTSEPIYKEINIR